MPSNVKSAYVSIAGGGAAGITDFPANGATAVPMGSGASGGFLSSYPINLTPGESIPITIGVGGQPDVNLGPLLRGGTTTFGSYLNCTGGVNWANHGDCGPQGGAGVIGQSVETIGGYITGGITAIGYGSGGGDARCQGCSGIYPTTGAPGAPGVVIIDVLY